MRRRASPVTARAASGRRRLAQNVTTFTVRPPNHPEQARDGVVHGFATKFPETLAQVHAQLPAIQRPSLADLVRLSPASQQGCDPAHSSRITLPPGVHVSQRNTPALFGGAVIDQIPDRVIYAQEHLNSSPADWRRSERNMRSSVERRGCLTASRQVRLEKRKPLACRTSFRPPARTSSASATPARISPSR